MVGFMYYVPGAEMPVTREKVKAAGIEYAISGAHITATGVRHGPAGAGLVVADCSAGPPGGSFGYYPDRQTWHKIPGTQGKEGPCWVGWLTDTPPGPADLQRKDLLAGHNVTLADGREWVVPVAISMPEGAPQNSLPMSIGQDGTGEWSWDVEKGYAALWTLAERVFPAWYGDGTMTRCECADGALLALAHNYRLGKTEVAALGLFTTRNVIEVLAALVDWPTVKAWHEKKEQAAATTGPLSTADGAAA